MGRARTLDVGDSAAGAPNVPAAVLFLVVVATAFVSLALIQEARQRGEVLDLVEATDSFAPRAGERARIEWRQRETSDDAVVEIIDTGGRPVRTLLDGGTLEGGDSRQVFHWNGRTDSGQLAPPGRYRVEIVLPDEDRDIVPEQSAMRLRAGESAAGGG